MGYVLGIHNGHHASCALVRDGELVAAIEQERLTRVKGDGADGLTNQLPVDACLRAAGISLVEVDLIVSSFQSMAPGGVGLARPLAQAGFKLFEPHDPRHIVISHHLAHALCAIGCSGFPDAAVVVGDLAGSTTLDGSDFAFPYEEFKQNLTVMKSATPTMTECLSIYNIGENTAQVLYREYCVPHNTPEVYVCSAASLYDNVARLIFDRENAHGELMALAALGAHSSAEISVEDIVEIRGEYETVFRNDWQHRVRRHDDVLSYAPLANVVQRAFERVLLAAVRRARALSGSRNLAASGGVFLNINVNSRIASCGLFDQTFVPSSPHDAGIAVGCAYYGWRSLSQSRNIKPTRRIALSTDRLGTSATTSERARALEAREGLLEPPQTVTATQVAELFRGGAIIGRFAGRAEFGPRALGGRSLLCSAMHENSKDILNRMKGRQSWRPVAPIVTAESFSDFFEGPVPSPYMNLVHRVKTQHRDTLVSLAHPDGSARVQTLERDEDPFLHDVLGEFGRLTGYPILVNTSFNGPGQPILESPEDALDFLLRAEELDGILLEQELVRRDNEPLLRRYGLADEVIVTRIGPRSARRVILIREGLALEVPQDVFELMDSAALSVDEALDDNVRMILIRAARQGFLVRREDRS